MIEVPPSPSLHHIYEEYFFFGELQANMAMPTTAQPMGPSVSTATSFALGNTASKQTLPSIADWTLTKPPEPQFTRQMQSNAFIENNMNNFNNNNNNNNLTGLLTGCSGDYGLNNKEQEVSAFLQELASSNQKLVDEAQSPIRAETPTKQPQKFLNRYIAVLDQNAVNSQPEAPTFEALARNRYACNLCKEVVNSVHEKFIHRNKHLGRTFQCQYCGMVFPTSIDVVRHVHIMHRNSQKCPKCDYVATDKDTFFAHLDKAHPVSVMQPAKTSTPMAHPHNPGPSELPVTLAPRVIIKREDVSSPVPTPSPKRRRLSSSSDSKSSGGTPRKMVADGESMTCELCRDKTTIIASQQMYVRHVMEQHLEGEQCPFPDCFREFEDDITLNKHLQCHTAPRKFKCSLCDKAFKTQSQSKKHEDEVHTNSDVRPYKCSWPDCDKRFKASKHLQVHYMIHTDQKPIACEFCDYRCRQRNSINYHYKTKHPGHEPPKIMGLGL